MNKTVHIIFRIISFLFIALGLIFIALVWIKGDNVLESDVTLQNSIISPFIRMTVVELILCAFLALIFPIIYAGKNPKKLIQAGIFIVILAGIALVSYYVLAGNSFNEEELQRLEVNVETSKLVGAAIYFTYILGGAAIATVLYSGISGMFKRQ